MRTRDGRPTLAHQNPRFDRVHGIRLRRLVIAASLVLIAPILGAAPSSAADVADASSDDETFDYETFDYETFDYETFDYETFEPAADDAPEAAEVSGSNCESSDTGTQSGLSNVGFETSNLDGWELGSVTEGVCVIGEDNFITPYEGDYMARVGDSQPSSSINQPLGPNEFAQTFTVIDPTESFVYSAYTYDYTGFDDFHFEVRVKDDSGAVIASYQRGAWGQDGDTQLKSSGWQHVELDLSQHMGEEVTISFSAGGTRDILFAFWVYIDSAESGPPPAVAKITSAVSDTGAVAIDQQTGLATISMPSASLSDLTIAAEAQCPNGGAASSVSLLQGSSPFPMAESLMVDGLYEASIVAEKIVSGPLSIEVECGSNGLFVVPVGSIALYEPWGVITDATSGEPIGGAEVVLYSVPNWSPGSGGPGANECQNDGGPWLQPAPIELGEIVSPYGSDSGGNPDIHPDVNPFATDSNGQYGWDVTAGCWFVEVSADGYETIVGPIVGTPSAITNLNLALEPVVEPVAPTAYDDLASIEEDSEAFIIDVLDNDEFGLLTSINATSPVGGSVECSLNGCLFQPDPGFNGNTSFSYTIIDPAGNSASAMVTIIVAAVNDAPVVTGFTVSAEIGGDPVLLDWIAIASDEDGDELSLVSFEVLVGGGEIVNGDHGLFYTPPATDDSGLLSTVALTVSDPGGLLASATASIELTPAAEPPTDPPACDTINLVFDQPELWSSPNMNVSSTTEMTLSCTLYEILLESLDPRHELGYQVGQTEEQWFLEGLNSEGEVVYTSATTGDLPEETQTAVFPIGIADLDGVMAFRAIHLGHGPSANSVHVGAQLIPVT